MAFVPALDSGTLAIVDIQQRAVRSLVPVGRKPVNALALPDGQSVLVSCLGGPRDRRLVVVDVGAGRVTASIPGIVLPRGSATTADGQLCYVTSMDDGRLYRIDPSRWTITGSVETGRRPCSVAVAPDGSRAYVANFWSNSVAVVDTQSLTVTGVTQLDAQPNHVRLSPSGNRLFVACLDGYVFVVDTARSEVVTSGRPTNHDSDITADSADDATCYLIDGWNQAVIILDVELKPIGPPVGFGALSPIAAVAGPSRVLYVACQAGALDVIQMIPDRPPAKS